MAKKGSRSSKSVYTPEEEWAIGNYAGRFDKDDFEDTSSIPAGMRASVAPGFGLAWSEPSEDVLDGPTYITGAPASGVLGGLINDEPETQLGDAVAMLRARISAVHAQYPGCRVEIHHAVGDGVNDTFAVWIPANVKRTTNAQLTGFDHQLHVTKKVYVPSPKAPAPVRVAPAAPQYDSEYADLSAIGDYDTDDFMPTIARSFGGAKRKSPQQQLAELRARAKKAEESFCRAQRRKANVDKKLEKVAKKAAIEKRQKAAKKKANAVKKILREAEKAGLPRSKINCIKNCRRV